MNHYYSWFKQDTFSQSPHSLVTHASVVPVSQSYMWHHIKAVILRLCLWTLLDTALRAAVRDWEDASCFDCREAPRTIQKWATEDSPLHTACMHITLSGWGSYGCFLGVEFPSVRCFFVDDNRNQSPLVWSQRETDFSYCTGRFLQGSKAALASEISWLHVCFNFW